MRVERKTNDLSLAEGTRVNIPGWPNDKIDELINHLVRERTSNQHGRSTTVESPGSWNSVLGHFWNRNPFVVFRAYAGRTEK